ncbi:DEAD/DEAH box helicase, partial [Micrococcus sp. SIMBA_131]
FVESLPFPLTGAQNRVVGEILKDMQSDYRMNRLLQGDVGSGKTVVAAIGLYASYLAGHQGALMVPTEILAEQHYESFQELLGEKL